MRRRILPILAAGALAGCAILATQGEMQFAGSTSELSPSVFQHDAGFRLPEQFTIDPDRIHREYGKHCRGHYVCDYFADANYYYLVMNWNIGERTPLATIPKAASVIVDGRSGEVIKLVSQ